MINLFLNPLLYMLSGFFFTVTLYLYRAEFTWIGLFILLLAIPAWYARKIFLEKQRAALRLEEDFVP